MVLPALLEQGHTRQWIKSLLRGWTVAVAYTLYVALVLTRNLYFHANVCGFFFFPIRNLRSYLLGDVPLDGALPDHVSITRLLRVTEPNASQRNAVRVNRQRKDSVSLMGLEIGKNVSGIFRLEGMFDQSLVTILRLPGRTFWSQELLCWSHLLPYWSQFRALPHGKYDRYDFMLLSGATVVCVCVFFSSGIWDDGK